MTTSTDRRAEAARENGRKGGRPRKEEGPIEELEALGPPPLGQPLALARWVQEILATLMWIQVLGRVSADRAAAIRATASAIARTVPIDVIVEVERLLRLDQKALEQNEGGEVKPVTMDPGTLPLSRKNPRR